MFKKAKKVVRAVVKGTSDYNKSMKTLNKAAEKAAGKSGSIQADIAYQAKIRQKMKKEQGITWMNSVKKRFQ